MAQSRKSANARKKDLQLAILRIEKGRSLTQAKKLSVSSVAREAGVTPALIHNHYPAIAEEIRVKLGASSRQVRDESRAKEKAQREKNAQLRSQIRTLEVRIAQLASINELLVIENRNLQAAVAASGRVVPIGRHSTKI
ncbi:TetR family transcriptional regulator [Variovorax atrisoli]|uniref:TetR family transcriptional regulator n=1 Tax=Variovorax atrisoli TaxID=3394203 RepID=UPI00339594E2